MSERNWITLFAVIGLTVVSVGFGSFVTALYQSEERQERAISAYAYGDDGKSRPQQYLTERSGIPAPIESAISNPQPSTGQDHEKRDLAAQEASATFAWWMVLISGFGFIITTFATILLYQQIRLTREAVDDTGKATEAMQRQNDLAEAAQRPWLRADLKPLSITPDDTGDIVIWFELTIRNEGQSLAKNIVASRSCIQQPHQSSTDIDIGLGKPIDVLSNSLPPGGSDVIRVTTSFPKPPKSRSWNRYRAIIIVDIEYEGGTTRETWLIGEMRGGVVDRPWEIKNGSTILEDSIAISPYRHRKYE
jgi:hypothetical protein